MKRLKHSYKTVIVDLLTIVLACFMLVFSQMKAASEELDLPPIDLPESKRGSKSQGETSVSKPVVSIESEGKNKIYYLNEQAVDKDALFDMLKGRGARAVVLRGDADTSFSWSELAILNARLFDSGIREITYRLKEGK